MTDRTLLSHTDFPIVAEGLSGLLECVAMQEAFRLQSETIERFYGMAAEIAGPICPVLAPPADATGIERNFFSTFFLAVTRQLVGASRFLPLYAMVNQGMRAWVTACDNILDDEYKEVFRFGFDEGGPRMRSVLTLLLGDRIVSEYVDREFGSDALATQVGRVSLRALLPSALQECDEEQRPVSVLPVGDILGDIHKRKTGDLFEAPLALPMAIETIDPARAGAAMTAVGAFGLACQIVDDIKDMADDVAQGRHNLLVSMLAEQRGGDLAWLEQLRADPPSDWTSWQRFAAVATAAAELAGARFETSFDAMGEIGMELSAVQRRGVVACIFALLRVPPALVGARAGSNRSPARREDS